MKAEKVVADGGTGCVGISVSGHVVEAGKVAHVAWFYIYIWVPEAEKRGKKFKFYHLCLGGVTGWK